MNNKLDALAFGATAAIIAALGMLLLGILGNFGLYTGAVAMMSQWHMIFTLTPLGILNGMVEAATITFIFTYLFGFWGTELEN